MNNDEYPLPTSRTKTDVVEFYRNKVMQPFLCIESSFAPQDNDLINIRGETYKVLGRSFSVDYAGTMQQRVRCNVILELRE